MRIIWVENFFPPTRENVVWAYDEVEWHTLVTIPKPSSFVSSSCLC